MYVQREMNCYVKNMIKRKEYQKLNRIEQDHLLDIELEKIKKMKKKQKIIKKKKKINFYFEDYLETNKKNKFSKKKNNF